MDNENIENLNDAPSLSQLTTPQEVIVEKKGHTLVIVVILLIVVAAIGAYIVLK